MDNVISGGGSFQRLKKGLILENDADKTNDL